MAINLLDMIKDQVGDSVLSQAGSFLGESDSAVKSAMGAALPSILGSLIAKGGTKEGAGGLLDMISSGNHDGSIFDNLGGLLGGGDATSGFLNSGSGILKSLLGNNLGSVVDIIASVSGLKKGSSSSIMSMAAPLVMGMLGKYVKNKALDAMGLSKFLGTQKSSVMSALPAGMGSILGFGNNTGSTPSKPEMPKTPEMPNASGGGGGFMRKALPILGLLLVGWGVWNFMLKDSGVADMAKNATESVTSAAGDAVNTVGDAAAGAAGAVGDAASGAANAAGDAVAGAADAAGDIASKAGEMAEGALDAATSAARAALDNIKFAAGSVGEKFSTFMKGGASGDATFRFLDLKFATGSANISGSTTEVDNFAAVLKAYPNVNVEVGGYTDNTGNADNNVTLSQQRADAVKARLVAQGISADRISTKGYGAADPVASNDTAEGRTQNRRTVVRITKK